MVTNDNNIIIQSNNMLWTFKSRLFKIEMSACVCMVKNHNLIILSHLNGLTLKHGDYVSAM